MRARCQRVFSESDKAALYELRRSSHAAFLVGGLTGLAAPCISMGGETGHRTPSLESALRFRIPVQVIPD